MTPVVWWGWPPSSKKPIRYTYMLGSSSMTSTPSSSHSCQPGRHLVGVDAVLLAGEVDAHGVVRVTGEEAGPVLLAEHVVGRGGDRLGAEAVADEALQRPDGTVEEPRRDLVQLVRLEQPHMAGANMLEPQHRTGPAGIALFQPRIEAEIGELHLRPLHEPVFRRHSQPQ